jgi:DHA1 family bicyclomycin/chloramphenicol resistance-like MFS transporter
MLLRVQLHFPACFTHVVASPILFMDIFKIDAKTYGWIFMSLSFIGSSQLNSILLKKVSSEQMIYSALISNRSLVFFFLSLP